MPKYKFSIDREKIVTQSRNVSIEADTEEDARRKIENDIDSGLYQNDFGWIEQQVKYDHHMITEM